MRILITGGAGFIGSALATKLLSQKDVEILIFDNLSTGNIHHLPPSGQRSIFIKGDVNNYRDISAAFQLFHPEYVFHYAAVVGVKRTLSHPLDVLNDLKGLENVLSLCKNFSVKRIFFSSSSEVYGEPVSFPQNEETTPLNSRLPYAIVKNAGEVMIKAYRQEFGLNFTIFRFFNTYGPGQSTDFVVPKFIQLSRSNLPITLNGSGHQTRTFCYVDDNIEATTSTLFKGLCIDETVNIGNDNEISIMDLSKLIIQLTKSKSKVVNLPALIEGDMSRRLPDVTKMKMLLKHKQITLKAGLTKIIKGQVSKSVVVNSEEME